MASHAGLGSAMTARFAKVRIWMSFPFMPPVLEPPTAPEDEHTCSSILQRTSGENSGACESQEMKTGEQEPQ